MNLGDTIKTLRKKRGIKQGVLAEMCNISSSYLSQIENNTRELSITTLKIICDNLEISLPVFFFLALDENDIPDRKKDAYRLISPIFKNLLDDVLTNI